MYTKEDKQKAAKACLDFNKQQSEAHVTGDLECFPDRDHAINHARTLEDKTIEVFKRDEAGAKMDIVQSVLNTITANTKPDADLAKQQAGGQNLDKKFVKAPAKAAAPKPENTTKKEAAKPAKQTGKAAAKPVAAAKGKAVKVEPVTEPVTPVNPEPVKVDAPAGSEEETK